MQWSRCGLTGAKCRRIAPLNQQAASLPRTWLAKCWLMLNFSIDSIYIFYFIFAKLPNYSSYQAGLLCWVIPFQAQDLVFVFAELHDVRASHFFQPVEVLLNISPAPQYINCSLQFGVVHKFAESILHPVIQVIDKYLGFDALV